MTAASHYPLYSSHRLACNDALEAQACERIGAATAALLLLALARARETQVADVDVRLQRRAAAAVAQATVALLLLRRHAYARRHAAAHLPGHRQGTIGGSRLHTRLRRTVARRCLLAIGRGCWLGGEAPASLLRLLRELAARLRRAVRRPLRRGAVRRPLQGRVHTLK